MRSPGRVKVKKSPVMLSDDDDESDDVVGVSMLDDVVEGVTLSSGESRAVVRAAVRRRVADNDDDSTGYTTGKQYGDDDDDEKIHDQYLIRSPAAVVAPRVRCWHMYNVSVTAAPCDGSVRLPTNIGTRDADDGEDFSSSSSYSSSKNNVDTTTMTMTMTRRIGLRRVELIDRPPSGPSQGGGDENKCEEDDDDEGLDEAKWRNRTRTPGTYHIRINGSPVFVKGANMIPVDVFHGHGGGGGGDRAKVTAAARAKTERLLIAATQANMNASWRVWVR